jgi:hypothetical protein
MHSGWHCEWQGWGAKAVAMGKGFCQVFMATRSAEATGHSEAIRGQLNKVPLILGPALTFLPRSPAC